MWFVLLKYLLNEKITETDVLVETILVMSEGVVQMSSELFFNKVAGHFPNQMGLNSDQMQPRLHTIKNVLKIIRRLTKLLALLVLFYASGFTVCTSISDISFHLLSSLIEIETMVMKLESSVFLVFFCKLEYRLKKR